MAFAFGSSSGLARQALAGAPADVFLSADEARLREVEAAGLLLPGTWVDLLSNRLVVVEEGFPQSSVGDFIANQVSQRAFDFLDAPVITIAGKDVPMPYAANLEKLALPNVGEVVAAVKAVTYRG